MPTQKVICIVDVNDLEIRLGAGSIDRAHHRRTVHELPLQWVTAPKEPTTRTLFGPVPVTDHSATLGFGVAISRHVDPFVL